MGLTAMVVGSVSGFGMQMMNNALQKVPLSRSEYVCLRCRPLTFDTPQKLEGTNHCTNKFTPLNFRLHLHLSEPWLHVTYFFIGGWVGQRWVRLEKELVLDINEIRADKGLPPLIGTDAMLGLKYRSSA